MKPDVDYTLYLVTDRELMSSPTIEESVELAIQGGCTVVQLREKTASSRAFYDIARSVHDITKRYNVPLVINDRVDIALAVDAEGVHVGQDDLPAYIVRSMLGRDKIMGVSVHNAREARAAATAGADYLGVGAMYATATKGDADVISERDLEDIFSSVGLPMIAIGGINRETVTRFTGTGFDGIAVVSAIVAQPDVAAAARELKALYLGDRDPE